MSEQHNRLYPEDQAKVDAYLKEGHNSVERKPFRISYMWILLIVVTVTFTGLSILIERLAGVS